MGRLCKILFDGFVGCAYEQLDEFGDLYYCVIAVRFRELSRDRLECSLLRFWSGGGAIPSKVVSLGSVSSVVASLAAASASSMPGMSACPGTY